MSDTAHPDIQNILPMSIHQSLLQVLLVELRGLQHSNEPTERSHKSNQYGIGHVEHRHHNECCLETALH